LTEKLEERTTYYKDHSTNDHNLKLKDAANDPLASVLTSSKAQEKKEGV